MAGGYSPKYVRHQGCETFSIHWLFTLQFILLDICLIIYVRKYLPNCLPQVGSEPLPKASGWIPKDVIRLVQAFKHSYGIKCVVLYERADIGLYERVAISFWLLLLPCRYILGMSNSGIHALWLTSFMPSLSHWFFWGRT